MDKETALVALRVMLAASQKARSNLRGSVGDDELGERLLAEMHPWLFGQKCVIPALAQVISRAERGSAVVGKTFYHMMWIAKREPAIELSAAFMTSGAGLPQPDLRWNALTWS